MEELEVTLKTLFPGIDVIGENEEGSSLHIEVFPPDFNPIDVLSFLLDYGLKEIEIERCPSEAYEYLFRFPIVTWCAEWPLNFREWIMNVAQSGEEFPNVTFLKMNNIRWIFNAKELFWLDRVFPSLQKIEFVRNGSDEQEIQDYDGLLPKMTIEEIMTYLGPRAQTFDQYPYPY